MQNFIGLLTALLGSAGFALIFNVRKQLLPLRRWAGRCAGVLICWQDARRNLSFCSPSRPAL